jgi:hypothetical protein
MENTIKTIFEGITALSALVGVINSCRANKNPSDTKTANNNAGPVINGPVTNSHLTINQFNLNCILNGADIQKFDAQLLKYSAPITEFESPTAIESQKLWLCCMNQNEQFIACGAYFSCEIGEKTIRFWLGLIFSESEPRTGLYVRIPASEVKNHSGSKTVCGIKSRENEYRIPIVCFSGEPGEQDIQKWLNTLEEKSGELLSDIGAV